MPEKHFHHHHHHWRDREKDGYAHRAGEPGPGPNFFRFGRNIRKQKIAGVCAGFADYYGWNVGALRTAWVLSAVFFFPIPIFIYAVLAMVTKPTDAVRIPPSPEDERFWRTFSVKPAATFSELKHRFRALDSRVTDMERAVTSNEYGLKKAFRDLEQGT